jgi:sugar phosphate isomerase/epimerase
MADISRLSINQVTVLPHWTLAQFIAGAVRHRAPAISIWREKLHELGLAEAARQISGSGLAVSGLCFTGLISSPDDADATKALDDVRRAIDEAVMLKAQSLIFLSGAVDARDKNLARTRARVLDRLATLIPDARGAKVKLALEPLHPTACATRSVLTTVKLANDWCDALHAEDVFGIAIDAYTTWWDPEIEKEIARAGKRICAFHVSDWLADTQDPRLDRGMMGDGVIDLPAMRRWVEAAGYKGPIEVEIFSERNWWKRDADEVIRVVMDRFQSAV